RRTDPVARSARAGSLDRAYRGHARRDRRRRGRGVAGRASRAAVRTRGSTEPARPEPGARRQAHGLRLLPRPRGVDGGSDRRRRAADRALRSGLPRPHPRAPPHAHDGPREREPELRRRCDHGGCGRPLPVLHAARGAARPVLHPQSPSLPLLGIDPTGRRRPRDVRLLRGAERRAEARETARASTAGRSIARPWAARASRTGTAGATVGAPAGRPALRQTGGTLLPMLRLPDQQSRIFTSPSPLPLITFLTTRLRGAARS